jgi:hypothetical protein
MALEVQHFTATIPAGTLKTAPVTVNTEMPFRTVRQIDWRVPNGPMGVFGWQVAMGGIQVFPSGGDTWVVSNDEHGTWLVTDAPDSGAWQVIGYNTGANPHSVYLAFHVDLPSRTAKAPAEISPFSLYPGPDLSSAGPPVRRKR